MNQHIKLSDFVELKRKINDSYHPVLEFLENFKLANELVNNDEITFEFKELFQNNKIIVKNEKKDEMTFFFNKSMIKLCIEFFCHDEKMNIFFDIPKNHHLIQDNAELLVEKFNSKYEVNIRIKNAVIIRSGWQTDFYFEFLKIPEIEKLSNIFYDFLRSEEGSVE